jgi:hypothetical protein
LADLDIEGPGLGTDPGGGQRSRSSGAFSWMRRLGGAVAGRFGRSPRPSPPLVATHGPSHVPHNAGEDSRREDFQPAPQQVETVDLDRMTPNKLTHEQYEANQAQLRKVLSERLKDLDDRRPKKVTPESLEKVVGDGLAIFGSTARRGSPSAQATLPEGAALHPNKLNKLDLQNLDSQRTEEVTPESLGKLVGDGLAIFGSTARRGSPSQQATLSNGAALHPNKLNKLDLLQNGALRTNSSHEDQIEDQIPGVPQVPGKWRISRSVSSSTVASRNSARSDSAWSGGTRGSDTDATSVASDNERRSPIARSDSSSSSASRTSAGPASGMSKDTSAHYTQDPILPVAKDLKIVAQGKAALIDVPGRDRTEGRQFDPRPPRSR